MELIRRIPIHPFLFAAYPIISLLAFNVDQVYENDALNPLLISLFTAFLVLGVMRMIFKNWQLAGLLTSLVVVWFFLYGRLFVPWKSLSLFGLEIGRHRYLIIAWTGTVIAAAFWLIKRPRAVPGFSTSLNVFSLILITLPLIQIGAFRLQNLSLLKTSMESPVSPLISWEDNATPPDIYYIVLDAYTRSDVLADAFEIDNTPFLDGLRQMGFYIADCAQSNYTRTLLSLTSTFNMDYLQDLNVGVEPGQDTALLLPYLKNNIVRQQLEGLGYKTIVFQHPWERFIWDDAAIVYKADGSGLFSPFEYLLLRTTLARVYLDMQLNESRKLSDYTNYRDTLFALKQLPKVPEISGPKFVFVHLVIPHPPFVFGASGEKIDIPYDADKGNIYSREDYMRGYTAAVSYINQQMIEILPQLIQKSKTPPVIVLAGDHGTPIGGSQNAVRILNAYFTPESQPQFYKSITPVNTFRVLFNTYFNGSFDLLTDRSYLSAEGDYFDFQETPITCAEGE